MFHRIDRNTSRSVVFHWLLVCFLAAMVNVGGVLTCGHFVSHMSGFYMVFGQHVATITWDTIASLASIPFFFFVGVMISAYLCARPAQQGRKPHYIISMGLVLVCLCLAATLGSMGYFGEFGETQLRTEYLLIALLCMASGIQNGAGSIATANAVRSTHMTGTTTDLAIGVVRIWAIEKNTDAYHNETRAIVLRGGSILAFVLGAAIGAELFIRFHYLGFLFPAVLVLYVMIYASFGSLKNLQ
jgi:uncharacterized membrane protein YoaK (UPF0700 family)